MQPHLRLDAASGFEFLLSLASGFPEAMSFSGPFDAIGSFEDEELAETVEDRFIGFDFATIISSFCSCILFAIVFGTADQAGILSAASGAEMADVEQMKKIVPFVTCEIAFGQNICELMFGVDVPDLNFRI